ncbi:MAG: aminotransferase class V-fold PLP-dependent enzyme [Desulfobacterales bacterium]
MHANNEVGTIQPIAEIAQIAKQHGILLHTDAAQSVGKISTEVDTLGVDLLSIAGHKVYAPKGVGALFIRAGLNLAKFMHGAGQESGRRPGTENVLEIVGLRKACEIAKRDLDSNMKHMQHMRDRLHEGIKVVSS